MFRYMLIALFGIVTFFNVMLTEATECKTNCKKSCATRYGVIDYACKWRCETERALHCKTGFSGCSAWKSTSDYQRTVAAIQQLHNRTGKPSSNHQCHKDVDTNLLAASAGGAIYKAATAGVASLFKVDPTSFAVSEAVKHHLHCACNEVLWRQKSQHESFQTTVSHIYESVLGRKADSAGLEHHIALMQSGWSAEQIREGIANSQESRNNINKLYQKHLCRNADTAGMEHHVKMLARGELTLDQLDRGIASSPEAKAKSKSCQQRTTFTTQIAVVRDGRCLYTDNHYARRDPHTQKLVTTPVAGNVRVVPCNRGGRKGRLWEVIDAGGGQHIIKTLRDGKCLYTDGHPDPGNVRVVPCNRGGRKGRLWILENAGGGRAVVKSARDGGTTCLYTDNHPFPGNARVVPCNRGAQVGRLWRGLVP